MNNGNNILFKCALCCKEAKLQESHFIPKFVYKKMNEYKDKDKKIMIVDNKMDNYPVGKQIKKLLLCSNCEGILSKNGESYFAKNAFDQMLTWGFVIISHLKYKIVYQEDNSNAI
ncbi:hypothetical protein Xsto_03005 [Xenorhabdus stockiae]|uniref:HNH endonuclease n=1 Tax=Xenorhabdus stockiae TaxID=351614 RepID=A0A2D0KLZ9_9GAMM|nr:hypothetical protein [Xenorhabdus stockiae]PHM64469.1 hypothetical protein Xsto_03005 [Xenorhabdus stockiae]